jgi:hypothetical protein
MSAAATPPPSGKKSTLKPYIKPLSVTAGVIIFILICSMFLGNGCKKNSPSTRVKTEVISLTISETMSIDFCEGSKEFTLTPKTAVLVNLKNCASEDVFTTLVGPSPMCINESTGNGFLTSDKTWEPGLNWRLENRSSVQIKVQLKRVSLP